MFLGCLPPKLLLRQPSTYKIAQSQNQISEDIQKKITFQNLCILQLEALQMAGRPCIASITSLTSFAPLALISKHHP
jgi:hypothetical protein